MNVAKHNALQTDSEIHNQEEIIDTYDLFATIFKELGRQHSFRLKLDSTLPLIYGKQETLKQILFQFNNETLSPIYQTKKAREICISHTKDRAYWIFNFDFPKGMELYSMYSKISTQTLFIHKESIQDIYCTRPLHQA